LLVAAGLVVASRRWLLAGLFAAVFALIYLPAIELEEQHLANLFPSFQTYANRVSALWPTWQARSVERFQWRLYVHNREYQALAGFLAGAALLIAKVMVLPIR
jgi:hypothetical protein